MAMAERKAEVTWNGTLQNGNGELTLDSSGALKNAPVTWASRTENPEGKTSPEELLAAAHATCYAMSLSATLARGGNPPQRLHVTAVCVLNPKQGGGIQVTNMHLTAEGLVPGLDQQRFEEAARTAEQNCPISNALRNNVEISVQATWQG